jgi:hypothetical protein
MDTRVRKILDPAGMIEVEVRHDNVADVSRCKTQSAYLCCSGFLRPELWSVER